MSRNGSGTYTLPSGNPFVPSTVISSTTMNNTMSDIATALTQSIANDGQTTPVANLPMATFRHTNVGNAVARTDYAAAGQVQDSSLQWLTSVAGTDTITASITPSPSAYAAGQTFRFVAAGANTTTAVTLNINGLGAKNITKNGANALQAGDIQSGQVVQVVYDGTQFQLAAIPRGTLLNIQKFTTNGTYTPTPGTVRVIVKAIGGGGGGGGAPATGAGQTSFGIGGGSGSYAEVLFTTGFSGASVTVGAAGTGAAAGGNGTAGGATSFGALISCPGGLAGFANGPLSTASTVVQSGVGGGAVPTISGGTTLDSSGGGYSLPAFILGNGALSGAGGHSVLGAGAIARTGTTGGDSTVSFGAGGGGGIAGVSQSAQTGGGGGAGLVLVYEYS